MNFRYVMGQFYDMMRAGVRNRMVTCSVFASKLVTTQGRYGAGLFPYSPRDDRLWYVHI